jgi:hypothetical protein
MTLTTGSRSLLLGTSIQVISTAPGVPGEQGVSRSCSIILGSSRPGPNTNKIIISEDINKLGKIQQKLQC